MKITTVADMNGALTERMLMSNFVRNGAPDAVFLLGNNLRADVETVIEVCALKSIRPMPLFGVCGDKESRSLLSDYGIPDLHLKRVMFGDVIIAGFGGGEKHGGNAGKLMFTEKESELVLENFPYCDVLLAHSKPYFKEHNNTKDLSEGELEAFKERLDALIGMCRLDMADDIKNYKSFSKEHPAIVFDTSKGMGGIGEYIKKQSPQAVLHGDCVSSCYTTHGETFVKCCKGIETFEVNVMEDDIFSSEGKEFGNGKIPDYDL